MQATHKHTGSIQRIPKQKKQKTKETPTKTQKTEETPKASQQKPKNPQKKKPWKNISISIHNVYLLF